jgi:hypothetical protein
MASGLVTNCQWLWKSTIWLVLIRTYRGQLWKGKQNTQFEEKIEWNSKSVNFYKIIIYQKHLVVR